MDREPGQEQERRLNEVMAAYVLNVEAGCAPDRRELIAKHPDLAAEIEAFFTDYDGVNRLVGPLREAVGVGVMGETRSLADETTAGAKAADGDVTRPVNGSSPPTAAGSRIHYFGDFELIDEIARGGMGVVYRARQISLNRPVALKMILAGAQASKADLQRFRNEAEAAANLDHPGIVPIHEVGVHERHSYISMKLIEGGSLASRLSEYTADPSAAARLTASVARAVHHAHQRGILHRDLKPSNILLDHASEPYVSDFGLAKRVEGNSELTLSGAILGSPSYMAPEQTTGRRGAITTATDVYGLGASLYAMLAGRPPFRADSVMETIEQVRQREPEPPSGINHRVDRDLQTVCLKCLDKDPQRRYASALELAEDLDRWLDGRPITARRVGRPERTWRWARRNPMVASLSGLVLLLILGGMVGLAVSNAMISRRNAAVVRERDQARTAQAETALALRETEAARSQAEAVSNFLVDAFRKPDPEQDGRELKVVDLLAQAAVKLDVDFAGPTRIKGELLHALGTTFLGLGLPAQAAEMYEKSSAIRRDVLGFDHSDTLESRSRLACAYLDDGRTADAIGLDEQTLRLRESTLGPYHQDTLQSRNNLAKAYGAAGRTAKAITMHEETLKRSMSTLGTAHPDTLISRTNLADTYRAAGKPTAAIGLDEETLKLMTSTLGPNHPNTLTSRNNLALAYQAVGRTNDAITMHQGTLRLLAAKLGPEHAKTLISRNNLANAYADVRRMKEAIALHEETLRLLTSTLGPTHPNTLRSRGSLASAYWVTNRTAQALAMEEETLALKCSRLGPDHPSTLESRNNLASIYWKAGRLDRSVPLFEEALRLVTAKLGPDDPVTLSTAANLGINYRDARRPADGARLMENALERARSRPDILASMAWVLPELALAYDDAGKFAQAELLYRDGLQRTRKQFGPKDFRTGGAMASLGWHLLRQGKCVEAEPLLRKCLAIGEKAQPGQWATFNTRSLLGGSLLGQRKYTEAEPLILSGYDGIKSREAIGIPVDRVRVAEAATRVVQLYEAWGKPDRAAAWKMQHGRADLPADVFAH